MSPPAPLKETNELSIRYMAKQVRSSDKSKWLPATVWFCGLLSGKDPSIARVLDSKVLPFFMLFLTDEWNPKLQVEAAKVLKYIASGPSENTTVTIGQAVNIAHDALRDLMHSNDDEVLRHACCSLALLSGCENVKVQQLIRESGLYNRFLELIRDPTLVHASLRALGNIVEGDQNLIDSMIGDNVLVHLRSCLDHEHVDVRKEACWLISYITAGNERRIQLVLDADLIGPLVNLIKTDTFAVMEAAVRAISNATLGATQGQIMLLVSRGCVEPLCHLFCCRKSEIFNDCLVGLEAILEAGDAEKGNETDVNTYAERINSIGGWNVLVASIAYYEKKLFKKALEILIKYGPEPWLYNSYLSSYSSDEG